MPCLFGSPRQKMFSSCGLQLLLQLLESLLFLKVFLKNRLWKKKSSPLAIVFIIFTLISQLRSQKDILVKSWVTCSELLFQHKFHIQKHLQNFTGFLFLGKVQSFQAFFCKPALFKREIFRNFSIFNRLLLFLLSVVVVGIAVPVAAAVSFILLGFHFSPLTL